MQVNFEANQKENKYFLREFLFRISTSMNLDNQH